MSDAHKGEVFVFFKSMKNILIILRNNIYVPISSAIMWLNSVLINSTVKLVVVNEGAIDRLHKDNGRILFAFWHQATFTLFNYYRGKRICSMPVDNYLGQILKGFLQRYGFKTVTYPEMGSSTDRVKAITRVIRAIKDGWDCGIAVDGPPNEEIFKAKPGVFFLAQRSGSPILPVGIHYEKQWEFKFRWDRYLVPKFFSKAVLVIGDPIHVKENLSEKDMGPVCRELEEKLRQLTEKAKKVCLAR